LTTPSAFLVALDGADAEPVVDHDLAAKDSCEDKHPRQTCKNHVLEGAEFTLVLGELIRGKDGELDLLGTLVLAQLCCAFALPVAAVLAVVNDLANGLTGLDDFMGIVGAVCALLDALDAVAFKAPATLLAARSRCSGRDFDWRTLDARPPTKRLIRSRRMSGRRA
jgi:hypothetical protein